MVLTIVSCWDVTECNALVYHSFSGKWILSRCAGVKWVNLVCFKEYCLLENMEEILEETLCNEVEAVR